MLLTSVAALFILTDFLVVKKGSVFFSGKHCTRWSFSIFRFGDSSRLGAVIGSRGVMVIVVRNGHSDTSSNPGRE